MIYLDSAATSLIKPVTVENEVVRAMRELASPGRGGHRPSLRAAELVYDCRSSAAELFGLEDPSGVVFTFNATHALNIAITTLLKPGARVLVSGYEHNSVTRPLNALGAEIVPLGRRLFDGAAALEEFAANIERADLVVCSHVSNVFGYIQPVYEIGRLCRENKVPYIVDASQSAGVLDVDIGALCADFVCMPGHKGLMGPQGTGLLLCASNARPLMHGGSGSDSLSQLMPDYLPDRLEAGTHNVCGIAGLKAGIDYVRSKGINDIFQHEKSLLELMIRELKGEKLELYCSENGQQSGVLSFRCAHINCEDFAQRLSENDICVRSGLHCAPCAHQSAGTETTGTVRLSFSPFITEKQICSAARTIKQIINNP